MDRGALELGRGRRLVVMGLLSGSLISLELVWTRIFSAEFFYSFAFLTLSLAVAGLGLGGLALRLVPSLNRPGSLSGALSLTAGMALAGPPLVFRLGLDFSRLLASPGMMLRFAVTVYLLSSTFFLGGIALALMFKAYHADMSRLYMADLLGAGAGVLVGIGVMNRLGTPAAAFLSPLPLLGAALLVSRGWKRLPPLLLAGAAFLLAGRAGNLLEMRRPEPAPVIESHWDAMAKIKVHQFNPEYRELRMDNAAKSAVYRFDGDWDRPDREPYRFGISVEPLVHRFDRCVFLSLGAGGGADVLQALQAGAGEIHAVEVNPRINRMMLTGDLAEFTGGIYRDPRVTVATEDARAYVKRHPGRFDLIYSLSSNTYAALASGSFALAENYLFTREAFQDYWRALTDRGFLIMEHQFYLPRLVSGLLEGLRREGVADPAAHLAVYRLSRARTGFLLLSREPLSEELIRTAFAPAQLLYPPDPGLEAELIPRIVRQGWEAVAPGASIDVSPSTDDRPFIAQMGRWRNLRSGLSERLMPLGVRGFPLAKALILVILAVVLVLLLPLNLAPYLIRGLRLRPAAWLYFFVIGMAFMIVEVILIQRFTLLVGPSVYSIAAILLTLLAASGVGARFSHRVGDRLPFLAIAGWIVLDALLEPVLVARLGGAEMGFRLVATVLAVAPLGFFMGMPFPKGARRVAEGIDWGFAVNGVASVLGSTAVMLVAFQWGLTAALGCGGVLYLAAGGLISARRWW